MPPTDKEHDGILPEIARRLRDALGLHLRRIVLFGSRARGQARIDSDYDILVVVDARTPSVEAAIDDIAGEVFCETGRLVSLFPVDEQRLQEEIYNPLFIRIREEGIAV